MSCSAGLRMSQHITPRIPAGLSPAHRPPLIRLLSTSGHRGLPWAGACLALTRQVWPQGLRGHAKCNMGSSQKRRAETGAAGAEALNTGAEKNRKRGKKEREEWDWRREGEKKKGKEKKGRRERGGRGGMPVGDLTPQRGKVVAYTQASKPRTQASTYTLRKNYTHTAGKSH